MKFESDESQVPWKSQEGEEKPRRRATIIANRCSPGKFNSSANQGACTAIGV